MQPDAPGNSPHSPASAGDSIGPDPRDLPPPDAVKSAFREFAELREYAAYYIAARIDAIRHSLRRFGAFAALGIIGFIALGALIVTAVVYVCAGLAQLFTAWFGGRAWAGNLVAGILLLAIISGAAWFGIRRMFGSSRRKTVRKYELRRKRQRADFGHDVARRAHAQKRI